MKPKTISAITFSLFLAGSMLVSSCKHEPIIQPSTPLTDNQGGNGSNGNGNNGNGDLSTCDPDTVYFQNDILPLFVSKCAMTSGCHSSDHPQEGIVLNSYSNIINTGNIRAFDVMHGKIYKVITTTDVGDRMPRSPNPPLASAEIDRIAKWINQGALNNACNAGAGCDTSNVTFAGTIAPLLSSKCTGCHNAVTHGANINLATYNGVYAVAVNGRLSGAVNHNYGFVPMPQGTAKLQDCQLAQIRIWIQNGSLNN
jgi:hypothetical protein